MGHATLLTRFGALTFSGSLVSFLSILSPPRCRPHPREVLSRVAWPFSTARPQAHFEMGALTLTDARVESPSVFKARTVLRGSLDLFMPTMQARPKTGPIERGMPGALLRRKEGTMIFAPLPTLLRLPIPTPLQTVFSAGTDGAIEVGSCNHLLQGTFYQDPSGMSARTARPNASSNVDRPRHAPVTPLCCLFPLVFTSALRVRAQVCPRSSEGVQHT